MGGSENGNANAEQPPLEIRTLQDELRDRAMAAMTSIATTISALTPQDRWELVKQLEATRKVAIECGTKEPEPEEF